MCNALGDVLAGFSSIGRRSCLSNLVFRTADVVSVPGVGLEIPKFAGVTFA